MQVDQNSVTLKPGNNFSQIGKAAANSAAGDGKGNEIQRYREALAKMEAQWESATKALNDNVLHQEIQTLNARLTANNQEIIRLKKENQVLRLQNNMINPADSGAQEKNDLQRAEYKRQLDDMQMKLNRAERLKSEESEKSQALIVSLQAQLAAAKSQKPPSTQVYSQPEPDFVPPPIKPTPQVSMQDQTASEAVKRLYEVETEYDQLKIRYADLTNQNHQREKQLQRALEEMTQKKEQIEEEFTRYGNQDRVLREKCDQLEGKTSKMQQTIEEQDYELIKLQKNIKEVLEDKDKLLAQIHENETQKDSTFGELQKARGLNHELDLKFKDLQQQVHDNDPEVVAEQKALITELKGRVNVLEKELLLVTASTSKEIAGLRKQKEQLTGRVQSQGENQLQLQDQNEKSVSRARSLLETSKQELELASSQIGKLKKELELQQAYYEKQLTAAGLNPNGGVSDIVKAHVIEQVSQTGDYNQLASLTVKDETIERLTLDVQRIKEEKEAADKMVDILKNELRLQSDHFEKQARSQAEYYTQLAEKSVQNERHIEQLVTRLTSEQNQKYKIESEKEQTARATEEMGLEKVKVLQIELEKQEEFFKIQERNHIEQIESLQAQLIQTRLIKNNQDEQVNELVELAGTYKRENRSLKTERELAAYKLLEGDERLLKLRNENQMLQLKNKAKDQGINSSGVAGGVPGRNSYAGKPGQQQPRQSQNTDLPANWINSGSQQQSLPELKSTRRSIANNSQRPTSVLSEQRLAADQYSAGGLQNSVRGSRKTGSRVTHESQKSGVIQFKTLADVDVGL